VRLDERVCVAFEINADAFVISIPGSPLMRDSVYTGRAFTVVKLARVDDLSIHRVSDVPDVGGTPVAYGSVASNHNVKLSSADGKKRGVFGIGGRFITRFAANIV
jgi:hypothetical protein